MKEKVVHSLFGGLENEELYNRYLVNLGNIDNSFRCNWRSFINEVNNYEIPLTDRVTKTNDLLYE